MTLVDPDTAERSAVVHYSPDPSAVLSTSWSNPDARPLRKRLKKQLKVLAGHWSDETIYPGSRSSKTPEQPASHGQCGVTSAWLMSKLSEPWRSAAHYCVGDVVFSGGEPDVAEFHCWVEIGDESSPNRLVVDLTCDQFKAFRGERLVCEEHRRLMGRSIEYRASSRRAFEDLHGDSVWARYEVLDQSMKRTVLKRIRKVLPFGSNRSRRGQSDVSNSVGAQAA